MRGYFKTKLVMEDAGNGRHFILREPLIYHTRVGEDITVPAGFITDLASIPRPLFALLPPIGKYDYAAVVHDFLYRTDSVPVVTQDVADDAIRLAMEDSPHPPSRWVRWTVWAGVKVGGHHSFHQHPVTWVPTGL